MAKYRFDSWYAVVVSFLFWCGLYSAASYLFPSKSPEFWSRVVTLVHGCFAAFQGLTQCFMGEWTFTDPNTNNTDAEAVLLTASLGYFMEDLLWCLYHQSESKLMIAHHIYSVIALARVLFGGQTGGQSACGLGAMEVTNPLLQARWFIRSAGKRNTSLFMSVEITFIICFFLVRIVIGTFVSVVILFQAKNYWEYRLLVLMIYIMSWMFMYNMTEYLYMKYLKGNVDSRLPAAPSY